MSSTSTQDPKFGLAFWIKLALTILSAFAASLGASACGLTDVVAVSTGIVAGGAMSALG